MQPRDRLTRKEVQVATLVWQGLTYNDNAGVIGTGEQVVKNHLRTTLDKLGVGTHLELALYVASHGGAHWHASLVNGKGSLSGWEGTSALEAGVLATARQRPQPPQSRRCPTISSVKVYWLLTPTRRAPSEIAHRCPRNGK